MTLCGKLAPLIRRPTAPGLAAAWATVKVLKAGLAPPRRAPPAKMKKADGSLADTPEENASVFADTFSQLYGREASFDPSVLNNLPQRQVAVGLDHVPTDDEIQLATSKLHATAPGPSGLHARLWQALVSTSDGFGFVRHLVQHFWTTEELPTAARTARAHACIGEEIQSTPQCKGLCKGVH